MLFPLLLAAAAPLAAQLQVCDSAAMFEPCEISFEMTEAESAEHPNPYVSVELRAEFRSPDRGQTKVVSGFWDGVRTFRFRFAPDFEGRWDFRILSNLSSVNEKTASFQATPAQGPGFIEVFNTRYFRYPSVNEGHFWMGDTNYRFATIPWESFTRYVDARAEQKFNHVRGLLLGWEESAQKVLADPDLPLLEHFRELDRRIAYLNSRGVIYDVLLAGDRNQLVELLPDRKQRERYVRYVCARYAAFNVTWQGVQEFEEYPDGRKILKEVYDTVRKWDPYDHPRSTHAVDTSSMLIEDGWMTYIVQQSSAPSLAAIDYQLHAMPVVNSELGYENSGAGASHDHHVSSDEFRRRLWRMAMRGHYTTFGNTGTYGGRQFDFDLQYLDSPGARYMGIFHEFMTQTRYFDLQPYYRVVGGTALSLDYTPYLAEEREGVEYIVYCDEPASVELLLPKDGYDVSWFDPLTGEWFDQKKKFKGDRFQSATPDDKQDWVLYIRKEGKKESWNKKYFLEARGVKMKEVETATSEVPYAIQFPDQEALTVGQTYEFNATLTKDTRAARRMLWVWNAEVAGSGKTRRILGTTQFGQFKIPLHLAETYPATLSVRLLGIDGAGKLFEAFRAYRLEKE